MKVHYFSFQLPEFSQSGGKMKELQQISDDSWKIIERMPSVQTDD